MDKQGRLTQWPTKRADKLQVLAYLASKFELGKHYTELEVNELLKVWHTFNDWPLLRRELFDKGFVDRNRDGSDYRLMEVTTGLAGLTLVNPVVERDARAGVAWLTGEEGRKTLRLMGNPENHIKPPSLDEERDRVRGFITSTEQTTWMVRYRGDIVGAVWIDLHPTRHVPAPAVHIMIGDPSVRGKGIGENTVLAVASLLRGQGDNDNLYSRHLVSNDGAARLLAKVGFRPLGKPYKDEDGLEWQNAVLDLSKY